MGITVNAAEAAQLAHVSERTMRAWLTGDKPKLQADRIHTPGQPWSWAIDTFTLAKAIGRDRDFSQEELARIGASRPTAARLEVLEREVQTLRARIRTLEARNGPVARSEGQESLSSIVDTASYQPPSYRPPVEPLARSFSMSYAPAASGGTFRTRSDAARWLMRHGLTNEHTPKSWPGWRDVELEPRPVLQLALSLYDPSNWRITWRLHPCDDSACVCHELLPGQSSQ